MLAAPAPRLSLRGITKRYPAVIASDDVDLDVRPGEIHALVGENGAGKSTLTKIIYGVTTADAGTIAWEGREVTIANPAAARHLGIGMVFQHFALFETLTVAENIALALDDSFPAMPLSERIRTVSQHYGLPIDPRRLVHGMSVGERQRVEIVRCLLQRPRLLILDEPTSVLTPQAVRTLFATLRGLAGEGCSVLYISHKLDEIRELCDVATILRSGRVVGSVNPRERTAAELAQMMIGSDVRPCLLTPRAHGPVRLEIANLSLPAKDPFGTALDAISLQVHAGEIVGIAGVSGSGQKELLAALSGETRTARDDAVLLDGEPVGRRTAGARRRRGLAFIPEERLGRGAVPSLSLAHNALLTGARQGLVRAGMVRRGRMRGFAQRVIERFEVRCRGPGAAASSLSGGNLQKFIVGREIMLAPKVMLVAQPTWGVDVGATQLIRQALIALRDSGVALLVISEELDELFEISDRIAVIAQGRMTPARPVAATNMEQVGLWMTGAFHADPRSRSPA